MFTNWCFALDKKIALIVDSLASVPCHQLKVSPYVSLNLSKGVIKLKDLEAISDDKILENLSPQGVTAVKTIKISWSNFIPTNTLILMFNKPILTIY